jgi:hypothetical protein
LLASSSAGLSDSAAHWQVDSYFPNWLAGEESTRFHQCRNWLSVARDDFRCQLLGNSIEKRRAASTNRAILPSPFGPSRTSETLARPMFGLNAFPCVGGANGGFSSVRGWSESTIAVKTAS